MIPNARMAAYAALLLVMILSRLIGVSRADETRPRDVPFLRALSLIAAEKKPEAYSLLETVFKTSPKNELRLHAARLLAHAGNPHLKARKRHHYAEYALTHGKRDAGESAALLRIAGDGYFDEAKFDDAVGFYEGLASTGDDANVDYAQYKMGWIDLNRGKAPRAFERWAARLRTGGATTRDLREAMTRDLGRAWAESVPPSADQTETIRTLDIDGSDKARLVDGVVAGLRRLTKAEDQAAFREQVLKTDLATAVLTRLLAQSVAFPAAPCAVLDWLDSAQVDVSQLNNRQAAGALARCLAQLRDEKGRGAGAMSASPQRDRLVAATQRIRVAGLDRWMRAQLYQEAAENALACLEYLEMGLEHFEATALAVPSDAIHQMATSCQAFAKSPPSRNVDLEEQIDTKLLRLTERYAGVKGMLSPTAGDSAKEESPSPFYAIVLAFQDRPRFRDGLHDSVLAKPTTFSRTLIPVLVAAALLKTDATGVEGTILLQNYAPKPVKDEKKMTKVWLELLRAQVKSRIEHHDYLGAKNLLAAHVPAEPTLFQRATASEVWFLWILGLPADPRDQAYSPELVESGKKITRAYLLSFDGTRPVPPEARNLILASALKFDEIELLWNRWNQHAIPRDGDPRLMTKVYSRTIDLLLDSAARKDVTRSGRQESRLSEEVWYNSQGRCLTAATRLVSTGAPNASEAVMPESCEGKAIVDQVPFLADLRKLLALARGESGDGKLEYNSRLTRRIEGRFRKLNSQIELLKTYAWASPMLTRLARLTVGINCTRFIDDLESIQAPRNLATEQIAALESTIKAVVDLVKSWREVVLKETRAESKS